MIRLLSIKHWQLFSLLIGIPLILQSAFVEMLVTKSNPTTMGLIQIISTAFLMFLFFSWLYALGTNLYKKLPPTEMMNLNRFKLFMLIPLVYTLFLSFFLYNRPLIISTNEVAVNSQTFGLIVPVHLFSMFCIFYGFYFVAKALKTIELQKTVKFSDYAGEFFLLWFFPIGIWVIQPRINKLFYTSAAK